MGKLSQNISQYLSVFSDQSFAKKAYRAAQVRAMWADCVEEFILEHTNSVYIIQEDGKQTLIVYVDEGIFATELNARRELIRLKLLQHHNEEIDQFKIIVSRGSYKKNYPFKQTNDVILNKKTKPRPLSEEEIKKIDEIVSSIENEGVREKLALAIRADWEWKKSQEEDR